MNYNPYDLVPLNFNGQLISGRPFEFDSDVVNQMKMTNAFGNFVKPIKVSTMCPKCAQGLVLSIKVSDPPIQPVSCVCVYCNPVPLPVVDPFVNPLVSGRIKSSELDPLIKNINASIISDGSLIADRVAFKDLIPPVVKPPVQPIDQKRQDSKRQDQKRQDSKKTNDDAKNPKRAVPLAKADGDLSEEISFDDDMVEK